MISKQLENALNDYNILLAFARSKNQTYFKYVDLLKFATDNITEFKSFITNKEKER
jgi:hypothetical protein